MRQRPKPLKPKAKIPVAPKSPKNQSSKVRDLEKRLAEALQREADASEREAEALAQQTAMAEILRVISTSPTNLQQVLDAVVEGVPRASAGPLTRQFSSWTGKICVRMPTTVRSLNPRASSYRSCVEPSRAALYSNARLLP